MAHLHDRHDDDDDYDDDDDDDDILRIEEINTYERKSISKLQIVTEKKRMGIMTHKQHLFFKVISIQI